MTPRAWRLLAVCAAGLSGGWSFIPGGPGWLYFLTYVPLLWVALEAPSPAAAARWGWLAGALAWGVGIHWLPATVAHFMNLPFAGGVLIYLGYCAGHGLMAGLWAAAVRALVPPLAARLRRPYWAEALVSSAALVAVDGYFPQQFPIRFAISQFWHMPLLQSADLLGCAAAAWLIGAGNAGFYSVVHSWAREGRPRLGVALLAAAVLGANEAYGRARLRQADEASARAKAEGRVLRAGVVQADIPIDSKQKRERFRGNLAVHRRLTEAATQARPDLDVVVWPETSYERRVRYVRAPDGSPAAAEVDGEPLSRVLGRELPGRVPMLLSAIGESPGPDGRLRRYNTALLAGPDRAPQGIVEKTHLLPFGEYMPLARPFPWLRRFSPRTWDLSRGDRQRLLEAGRGARLGVLICYEVALPLFVRDYARLGANLLVNLSNDAWLTRVGAEQHLRVSALRCIETRRYLVRAVNSGVSAVVDSAGRARARLDFADEGWISGSVPLLDGDTVYMRVGALGYRLAALVLVLAAAWAKGTASTSKGPRMR